MNDSSNSKCPCPDELRIRVEQRDSAWIVRLAGSAHMDVSVTLREQLVDLVNENAPRLILDLAELEFINSAGLGAIIAAHLRCRRHNGDVKVVAPRPAIQQLLSITRLTKILSVHSSVDEALAAD